MEPNQYAWYYEPNGQLNSEVIVGIYSDLKSVSIKIKNGTFLRVQPSAIRNFPHTEKFKTATIKKG